MLDGTTNKQDARLIADIDAADPFDGGCAADCEPRTSVQAKLIERDAHYQRQRAEQDRKYFDTVEQLRVNARIMGVQAAITWLFDNDHGQAAVDLHKAHSRGEVLK